jgi:hypothetical protein
LKLAEVKGSAVVGDDAIWHPISTSVDSKNLTVMVASWLVTCTALIHLENLSTTTSR